MRSSTIAALVISLSSAFAPDTRAGEQMGPLPPGPLARSWAGPSDELIGTLAFDPKLIAGIDLPAGMRLQTLADFADGARTKAYLDQHPERRAWAVSLYELIGIHNARYDDVQARFDLGGDGIGGMAIWYLNLVPTASPDARALGDNFYALGTWLSDPHLTAYMRRRGFPAHDAKIVYRRRANEASAEFATANLNISARCRLEGAPFLPKWAQEPVSYQTMWTPREEAPTFEVTTWSHHRAIKCADPEWHVHGSHPFARAFNDPTLGDPAVYGFEFTEGYMLRSALYRTK